MEYDVHPRTHPTWCADTRPRWVRAGGSLTGSWAFGLHFTCHVAETVCVKRCWAFLGTGPWCPGNLATPCPWNGMHRPLSIRYVIVCAPQACRFIHKLVFACTTTGNAIHAGAVWPAIGLDFFLHAPHAENTTCPPPEHQSRRSGH